jgi:dihydroorotate dehydrogenase electron transfer subunit
MTNSILPKKRVEDLSIIENRILNEDYFVLEVESQHPVENIVPGQFVEILVNDSKNTFLRRPISIYDVHPQRNTFELLIQIVGEGTQHLSKLTQGQKLDTIYPLGLGYTLSKAGSKVLLVGGGVGIAPLLYLAKKLHQNQVEVHILLGGRGKGNIIETERFSEFGKVYVSTNDGSVGEKGLVTEHSIMQNMNFDMIYSCGPDPMMKAVARLAFKSTIECEVSLENMMACGIGACLCCVTPTTKGHQCVCTDGPVFNTRKLLWNQ